MTRNPSHRIAFVPVLLAAAMACPPSFAYQGPRLSASYQALDVRPTGSGVEMTFRFILRSERNTRATVEKIVLAGLAGPDEGYGTFDGGTLEPGGTLSDSATVVVPREVYDAWQGGRPPALYVYSCSESGDTVRTRVDAARSEVQR